MAFARGVGLSKELASRAPYRPAVVVAGRENTDGDMERLRLLAGSSRLLAAAFDRSPPLQEVAELAVRWFADVALVETMGEGGVLRRVAFACTDDATESAALVAFGPRMSAEADTPAGNVLDSGRPILIEDYDAGALARGGTGLRYEAALTACGAKSVMLVPLTSRGAPLGVLTLVSTRAARRFSPVDLSAAQDLAGRIGASLVNARLHERARWDVQARQDVLAFVSHELRNSLTGIFLNVEILVKSVPPEEGGRGWKSVDRIRRGTHQMRRMIEDLLDVTSIESGRLAIDTSHHDVGELFRDAAEMTAALALEKEISIRVKGPVAPLKVLCDRDRMMQVFANLIGNAVKFVPPKGTITLSAVPSGSRVLVAVRDDGPGIPATRLPHLFQRYWQAEETASKGRGLGLFIAKGLVEAQGGAIWAESEVGVGSTFFLALPVASPAEQRQPIRSAPKRPARRAAAPQSPKRHAS
jgi:signal transduction histidine kinase